MSERLVQSVNDTDRGSRQSMQTYESVWMSHWMRTSSDASEETRNQIQTKTFEIVNESFKMSTKSMGNEGMHSSLFKCSQQTDGMQALRPMFGHNLVRSKAAKEITSNGCHSPGEGTSKNPLKWMKPNSDAKYSSFAMPKPLQEMFVESSSQILPYGFKQLPNANLTILENEHEEKIDFHSQSHNDCYSLHKLQNCVHDVETMRICSTMDSVEGMPFPRFSQTTHRLLITKKTDVNLPKENDIFRSTRVITEINGKASSDLHRLSSFFGQGKRGVKLQPLSSSTDNEGNEDVGNVKASKVTIRNESSAETNTMDMDSFKEKNPYSASYSTTSTKAFNMLPRMNVASLRDVPDNNLELPASLSENTCPTSSGTQSLDMDKLLLHTDHPIPKSNLSLENSQDPGNRWVKRLKLNSSNSSAQCIKSSNLAENLSHEKMSKLFSRILESGITSEEPMQSLKENPKKKGNELLLSHAWIQRWLSNRSRITEKKPETVVVCEPQTLKLAVENLQKEQFPSIAAMALMGRAITGFQPCELQKRGSFTVWNTKAF